MSSSIVDNFEILSSFDVGTRSATAGNKEDLLDAITIVSPTETPFLSSLAKTVARGTIHEWLLDRLASRGNPDNGNTDVQVVPESYDASFTTPAVRKRLLNYTHILRKTVDVSDTQRAVNTAGIEDEYVYQLRKALIELATDIEFALVHSHLQAQSIVGNIGGTPADGRKMEGILYYLEPDPAGVTTDYLNSDMEGTITEAGSPIARLTETIVNDHNQAAWDKGVLFKTMYCNKVQKREVSTFTGNSNTRFNIGLDNQTLINSIDIYQGDFGVQAVVLDRDIPTREVLTLDEDYWKIAVLRPILAVELARTGNSTRAMIEAELTLEALAPATGGKIIWCSNKYGVAS